MPVFRPVAAPVGSSGGTPFWEAAVDALALGSSGGAGPAGSVAAVVELGVGHVFGELGFLTDAPRARDVYAAGDTVTLIGDDGLIDTRQPLDPEAALPRGFPR